MFRELECWSWERNVSVVSLGFVFINREIKVLELELGF